MNTKRSDSIKNKWKDPNYRKKQVEASTKEVIEKRCSGFR